LRCEEAARLVWAAKWGTAAVALMVVSLMAWLSGGIAGLAAVAAGALLGGVALFKASKVWVGGCTPAEGWLAEVGEAVSKALGVKVSTYYCPSELAFSAYVPGRGVLAFGDGAAELSNEEFWAVVWHEAAHIRERDTLVNFVLAFALAASAVSSLILSPGNPPWPLALLLASGLLIAHAVAQEAYAHLYAAVVAGPAIVRAIEKTHKRQPRRLLALLRRCLGESGAPTATTPPTTLNAAPSGARRN